MNVSLTHELEELIDKKVKSGLYRSASEVVREGLRLLKEHDLLRTHQLKELKREIAIGIKQSDKGESGTLDIGAIKAEGRKRLKSKKK